MDPAGLLISLATIAHTLDELSESYNNASGTLALIKTQIKILQTGTQRIQEWLHFTDPTSISHIRESLADAVATVNDALHRLEEDVAAITHTGPKTAKFLGRTGSDQWVKTKVVYSEGRMRKHLTDVKECASLMNFTLNVCQLPIGHSAEQEVRELALGARTLHRAHTSSRRERRSVIQESSAEESIAHSEDYQHFMTSVLDAEAELPEESPAPTRRATEDSLNADEERHAKLNGGIAIRRDEKEFNVLFENTEHTDKAHEDPAWPLMASAGTSSAVAPSARNTTQADDSLVPEPLNIGDAKRTSIAASHEPSNGTGFSAPVIPSKTPRPESFIAEIRPRYAQGAFRRKPVSRAASGASVSLTQTPSHESEDSSSTTVSPNTSMYSMSDKMTPLTQSLLSLSSRDYLNIELDQPPVQPYPDHPPAYVASSPPVPATPRTRRRNTGRSSILHVTPPIIQFAIENRLQELSTLLQNGGNVNEIDVKTGRTAIMEAARFHRIEACRILIDAGARLHLKDVEGNSVLHLAGREGDPEICQILIDGGAHAEDGNKDGTLPLQLAVNGGHTEVVLCLVNAMPFRKTNDTALVNAFLGAVKLGDVPTAQALLAKGVKTKKLKESWRLCAYAAQSGSLPMLELLLAQGCSVKEKSPLGWTPLHYAAFHGHQAMVERLLALKVSWKAQTKKTEETALHMAAAASRMPTAMALIAHKDSNVTMKDADSQEPIHHAVRHGDAKLFAALVDEGAKLKEANKYGWRPIHLAAAYGHLALLAECMTRGNSIEEKLTTPAFKPEKRTNQAARRGYWAEIRWPHSGSRPLHLALEFGHNDVANMLISGGAKLDESDSRGWRPLHTAAWSCRPEMVELLLQKGVTPDAKTVDGHTALTLGFREYGLDVPLESRNRIHDMLSMAIARAKKSKLKQMASFMNSASPSESKTANQRNLAWHTAQLAEALYQPDQAQGVEGEIDDISVDDSDIGVALSDGMGGEQQDMYDAQPGSSQAVAVMKG